MSCDLQKLLENAHDYSVVVLDKSVGDWLKGSGYVSRLMTVTEQNTSQLHKPHSPHLLHSFLDKSNILLAVHLVTPVHISHQNLTTTSVPTRMLSCLGKQGGQLLGGQENIATAETCSVFLSIQMRYKPFPNVFYSFSSPLKLQPLSSLIQLEIIILLKMFDFCTYQNAQIGSRCPVRSPPFKFHHFIKNSLLIPILLS